MSGISIALAIFAQELVIGLGFIDGLWVYAGIHPETESFKAFTRLVPEMTSIWFWVGVLVLTVVTILATHLIGKSLGLLALLVSIVGGIFVETWGIWIFVAALLIGLCIPLTAQTNASK